MFHNKFNVLSKLLLYYCVSSIKLYYIICDTCKRKGDTKRIPSYTTLVKYLKSGQCATPLRYLSGHSHVSPWRGSLFRLSHPQYVYINSPTKGLDIQWHSLPNQLVDDTGWPLPDIKWNYHLYLLWRLVYWHCALYDCCLICPGLLVLQHLYIFALIGSEYVAYASLYLYELK